MSYLGQQLGQGQAERFVFTASGGETSVTTSDDGRAIAYTVGQVDVYLNGAKLINGSDFTATTGTSITGLSALTASDVVEVFALSIFQASDTVSAASGGTFNGNVTVDANLSVTGTVDINGGNIDGTVIGAATPAAGSFTTVTADGLTVDGDVLITTNTATNPFVVSRVGNTTESLQITFDDSNTILTSEQDEAGRYGGYVFNSKNAGTTIKRMEIAHTSGDISFYEDTGTTPKFFWDASAESLGIGTSSPSESLETTGNIQIKYVGQNTDPSGARYLIFNNTDTTLVADQPLGGLSWVNNDASATAGEAAYVKAYAENNTGTSELRFGTGTQNGATERMRIDSSGRLLVGKSASNYGTEGVEIRSNEVLVTNDGGTTLSLNRLSSDGTILGFAKDSTTVGSIGTDGTTAYIAGASKALKLEATRFIPRDSDDTSADATVDLGGSVHRFKDLHLSGISYSNTVYSDLNLTLAADYNNNSSAGNSNILFQTDGSERARIDSSGNVGIGTTSPARQLHVKDSSTYGYARVEGASGGYGGVLELVSNSLGSGTDFAGVVDFYMTTSNHIGRIKVQRQSGAADNGDMLFYTATGGSIAEKARIDSSGNLLVGTTTANPTGLSNNTPGVELSNTGGLRSSVDDDVSGTFNRKTNEGPLLLLRVDGDTKGIIGIAGSRPYLSNRINFSVKIDDFANGSFIPADEDGAASDNVSDIGSASARWDDIYATNSTIQTSDANEKQDVAELDEAERRAAVAAKGLLRKFRWIDSVEAKGDEARIHFGIIAQDLQAAFEAEGLDAGRYAMFIHSTWTDEETGEERSRMGVRYSELLAFIIAAL